jgi:hypothetical protein
MSTKEPEYSANVTRKYDKDKDNKYIKQNILDYDNKKIEDTDFDKVLSEAYKLYEGEIFTGSPIDVNYMSKDAFIVNGSRNGSYQKIENSKKTGLFENDTGRKEKEDQYGKNLLQAGMALIANRAMDCSRMFSYPRTYLINLNKKPLDDLKPNIRDYQRIILVDSSWNSSSNSNQNTVAIIDIAPYSIKSSNEGEKKQAIPYNLYIFDLVSVDKYYNNISKKPEVVSTKNDLYKGLYVDNLLKNNFNKESNENFVLELLKQTRFKITDLLTTYDKVYSGLFGTTLNPFIHPIRELHLATLYIVDYYSRNRESPAYQWVGKTHNVLIYICNNMEKIKTVYDAAIYLGFLVTQLPVDEQQHLMFVMNTRLDGEKFKTISEMIEKATQKK